MTRDIKGKKLSKGRRGGYGIFKKSKGKRGKKNDKKSKITERWGRKYEKEYITKGRNNRKYGKKKGV